MPSVHGVSRRQRLTPAIRYSPPPRPSARADPEPARPSHAARPAVQHFLDAQTNRLGSLIPGDAHQAAVTLLGDLVHREALVLTYNDLLMLIGGFFVIGLMLIPLVHRPRSVLTADARH